MIFKFKGFGGSLVQSEEPVFETINHEISYLLLFSVRIPSLLDNFRRIKSFQCCWGSILDQGAANKKVKMGYNKYLFNNGYKEGSCLFRRRI